MLWGFFHSKLLVYQINPRKSHENPRKSPKNKQKIPEHLHLLMVPSGYQTQGERSLTLVADLALPASWPRAWVLKCCCKTVPWWRWGGWSWGAGKWWKFSGYHPDYFRIDLEYLEWRCTWDIYRVYIYKYNYIYMYKSIISYVQTNISTTYFAICPWSCMAISALQPPCPRFLRWKQLRKSRRQRSRASWISADPI